MKNVLRHLLDQGAARQAETLRDRGLVDPVVLKRGDGALDGGDIFRLSQFLEPSKVMTPTQQPCTCS